MPELPEVETIKNDLRALVVGHTIAAAHVVDPRIARYPSPADFAAGLAGERIVGTDRRAKYLLIRLGSGRTLAIQLAITGQLLLNEATSPRKPGTRLILDLEDGTQLRLVDASHLARAQLLTESDLHERLPLDELGPEVTSDELTLNEFRRRVASRRRQIKSLLLDQRVISGVGSIYADEALFAARLHPARRASTLSPEEVERLYRALRSIVEEAIRLRGTTTRWYLDVRGQKGHYQEHLRVVGRTGDACGGAECSDRVVRTTIGGKETYLCPSCQKAA